MSYLIDICLDEIALEGLDGITLACLWCRLDQRLPKFPLALDPKSKTFLWGGITAISDVAFYRLPEPRALPTFPNQYRTPDEAKGIIILHDEVDKKEYPGCIINSTENDGIQGSCSVLKERVDVSEEVRGHDRGKVMPFEEVQERWGDSLVIMASQELRLAALVGPHGDPSIELVDLKYCLLEYIGRQRHHGINQMDFAKVFKLTAASLHNYRKDLTAYHLIDKKICFCESSKKAKNIIMLTLRRFSPMAKHGHVKRFTVLSTHIMQFLAEQPKKTAKFKVVIRELAKKLPYLASRKDWKTSVKKTYLLLRQMNALQVSHYHGKFHFRVDSLKLLQNLNDEKDDVAEEDTISNYDPTAPGLVAELPIQFQMYNLIDKMQHTPEGITYSDIERIFQLNGRFVRLIMDKNLLRTKLVKFKVCDKGRQRVRKFQTAVVAIKQTPKQDGEAEVEPKASTSGSTELPFKQTSLRYMKRRQRMLELIRKHRVQEGCFGMLKEIRTEEINEGRTVKCDRRSILRIVERLEKEGLCQTFSTVVMSDDGKLSRTVKFVMDVNVKKDDLRVFHIIQQVKFRMINFKIHHPITNQIRAAKRTKAKITGTAVVRMIKSKRPKRDARKRITRYETITRPGETKIKGRQILRSPAHDALVDRKGKEGRTTRKEDDDSDMAEKQYIWKKNAYGYLQKMERVRVMHRFLWYLVYGMDKDQSPKAPQSAVSGNQIPTIKQEFDENKQTASPTMTDEVLLESFAAVQPHDSIYLIGQSPDQSEMSVPAADQSENPSSEIQNQSDLMIGGEERTGTAGETTDEFPTQQRIQFGSMMIQSNIQSEVDEAETLKSAVNLLESIESGILPDKPSTSQAADLTPSSDITAGVTDIKLKHSESTPLTSTNSVLLTNAKVYLDVMDWRRFVQPLPQYKDILKGWCLLGDLILSIPLVTFCEVVPARYVIEGLEGYLKDPMLRLLLIKDMPRNLRRKLVQDRRYLFYLEEAINKVCSLGLGVYTPHHMEGKEMLSTYICRNVTFVDTTSSKPSPFFVSDQPYPSHKHYLGTLDDLEKFWFDLHVICLDTPLGTIRGNSSDSGFKQIIKGRMTTFARKAQSWFDPVVDDGQIPGDGRGAGGLDSSLYSHMRRNWMSETFNANQMSSQRFQNRFEDSQRKTVGRLRNPLKRKSVALTSKTGAKENVPVETRLVNVNEHKAETTGGKGLKRKRVSSPRKVSEARIAREKRREEKKKAKEERKLQRREKRAVGIITRKVFNWTPVEDTLLLLSKVASSLLNRNLTFNTLITWETVQQTFVKKVPSDINLEMKDAMAISKRSTRLMRDPDYRMNYAVCLGEVQEDKAIMESIKPLSDKHSAEAIAKQYEDLIDGLQAKFRFATAFSTTLPDDLTDLRSNYDVVPIAQMDTTNEIFFKDENATDLRRLTLHTIVLSTLSSQTASDYNSRLVFKLYEQYDQRLLHDVFLFCRSKGIVSRCAKKQNRRIVPSVPMSYQLSQTYIKLFESKMPHELPDEAVACYKTFLQSAPDEGVTFPQVTCGSCSCQLFLLLADQISCKIIVPKQVIILDSNLIDQEFLKESGLVKKDRDSSDSDSDSEDDSEEEGEDGGGDEDRGRGMNTTEFMNSTVQGIGAGERVHHGGVEVIFEEEGDEIEKVKTGAEISSSEPVSVSSGDLVKENASERNVMVTLDALADEILNVDSQSLNVSDHQMASVVSATDLDHSYSQSRPSLPDENKQVFAGSGDGENVEEDRPSTSSRIQLASGDAPRYTGQDGLTAVSQPTLREFQQQEANAAVAPHLKPRPRNATMKCLEASQSSFTKWMILQGLYAPGVCSGSISNLQENIAFNAFTIQLSQKEASAEAHSHLKRNFHPCKSLLEYLVRPCQKFVPMEALCKPSDLCQEAAYLEEVFKETTIKREGDSIQALTERLSKEGVDTATATSVIQIYEQIEEAGLLGVTLAQVKSIVGRVNAVSDVKTPVETYINMLLQQRMVLEVGANDLRLVATKHATLWTIQSQRLVSPAQSSDSNSLIKRPCLDRPLGVHQATAAVSEFLEGESKSPETVDLTEETAGSIFKSDPGQRLSPVFDSKPVVEVTPGDDDLAQKSEGKGQQEVIVIGSDEDAPAEVAEVGESVPAKKESSDNIEAALASGSTSTESGHSRPAKRKFAKVFEGVYEPVEFLPYPWRKANGKVNRPELFRIMRGLVLLVLAEPGIKESQILHHLKDLFRKVDSLKLLQMMSDLGLITRHSVTLPKPSLFGSVKSRHQPSVYYYQPSINCLTKMGTLFED